MIVLLVVLLIRDPKTKNDTAKTTDIGDSPSKSLDKLAVKYPDVKVSDQGQFPNAVTEPPAWLANDPLFDVPALFHAPAPEENAAQLYLDAFYDVEPELSVCFPKAPDRKPIAQSRSDRLGTVFSSGTDPTFNNATRDAMLADMEPILRKVEIAQERPKCVFQTGITINALIAHCQAARSIERIAILRLDRALEEGDLDEALHLIDLSLRMARDLGPRGGNICQLVTVAIESLTYRHMVERVLTAPQLKPEHTRKLLAILNRHKANRVDLFLMGNRMEYISHRVVLHDLQHREGLFPPGQSAGQVFRKYEMGNDLNPVQFDLAISRMTPEYYQREIDFLVETQRLVEEKHQEPYPIRKPIWESRTQQMRQEKLLLAIMLEPLRGTFDEAATRGDTKISAYQCMLAVKLWEQEQGSYPNTLAEAVQAAGLSEVPRDGYAAGGTMKYALLNNRPMIYSVGSDQQDQGGRRDWKFGQQPGDYLFPFPE